MIEAFFAWIEVIAAWMAKIVLAPFRVYELGLDAAASDWLACAGLAFVAMIYCMKAWWGLEDWLYGEGKQSRMKRWEESRVRECLKNNPDLAVALENRDWDNAVPRITAKLNQQGTHRDGDWSEKVVTDALVRVRRS